MNREQQTKIMDSFAERANDFAERVMNTPIIRESVTKRSDEKFKDRYDASVTEVRYG